MMLCNDTDNDAASATLLVSGSKVTRATRPSIFRSLDTVFTPPIICLITMPRAACYLEQLLKYTIAQCYLLI